MRTAVAAALVSLPDQELTALIGNGTPMGSGTGGTVTCVTIAGHQVVAKRIPLTEPELDRTTADLFSLPEACHYGIGAVPSPGFGAWRELAAHKMTTRHVLTGRSRSFPLLHHARVLPLPAPAEQPDVERVVAYWGPAVRARMEALAAAPASLVLFLEHVLHTLHDWLRVQLRTARADEVCAWLDRELTVLSAALAGTGLIHFDTHFHNLLTDGRRLCLTDHGLALSPDFTLDPRERAFYTAHRAYDTAYTRGYLTRWLVTEFLGPADRLARLHAYARGTRPEGMPRGAAELVGKYAQVGAVMEEFEIALREEGSSARFPAEAVRGLGVV